jgi:hypothetical protein
MAYMLPGIVSFNNSGLVCPTHHIQQDICGAARQNKHANYDSSRNGLLVHQHTGL